MPRALMSKRKQFQELRIVVEHFFEMRHQPFLVHGVTRETAAEVIVNAALGHVREGPLHELEETGVAAAHAGPPQQFEHRTLRKFGRPPEAPVDGIEIARNRVCQAIEFVRSDHHLSSRPRTMRECRHQSFAVVLNPMRLIMEESVRLP